MAASLLLAFLVRNNRIFKIYLIDAIYGRGSWDALVRENNPSNFSYLNKNSESVF